MKNVIDTWLKADQLGEGPHILRRGETGEIQEIIEVMKDANGNFYIYTSNFDRAPLASYSASWSYAPLEIR